MKKKLKIWLYSIAIIGVSINLIMYLYIKIEEHNAKVLFNQVKNNDKLYVYETYYRALNAAMYVENLQDTTALINYYSKIAKHDTTAIVDFEIKTMPIGMHVPVYVYRYLNRNSKIVELIDFNVNCWGYIKGYVFIPTTHKYAPSDSLIKEEEAFIANYNAKKHVQLINRIAKKINPYGWYCTD